MAGKKLGFLVVGVAAIAFFDLWPLCQVSNHVEHVVVSMKGIFIGWMALCIALVAMLPERIGIAWERPKGQAASDSEKMRIKVLALAAVGVGVGMTAITWLYIQNQGYTIGF